MLDTVTVGEKVGEFLAVLHEVGFIFGDLKPGNVIYDFTSRRVRVIDFGSVTVKGLALKQFTPGYDRESWQAGNRQADENYDVFSLGILMVTMLLGKTQYTKVGLVSILLKVSRKVKHQELRGILQAALNQDIGCAEISRRLTELMRGLSETREEVTDVVVNRVGMISVASFIFSLVYLHGFY